MVFQLKFMTFTFYALCLFQLLCPQIPEASIVVSPFSRENHAAFHIRNKRAQPLQRDLADPSRLQRHGGWWRFEVLKSSAQCELVISSFSITVIKMQQICKLLSDLDQSLLCESVCVRFLTTQKKSILKIPHRRSNGKLPGRKAPGVGSHSCPQGSWYLRKIWQKRMLGKGIEKSTYSYSRIICVFLK